MGICTELWLSIVEGHTALHNIASREVLMDKEAFESINVLTHREIDNHALFVCINVCVGWKWNEKNFNLRVVLKTER